jgi:hypothetical protein
MVAAATLAGATSFRSVADYIGDLPPEALERLGARRHPRTRRFVQGADPDVAHPLPGRRHCHSDLSS